MNLTLKTIFQRMSIAVMMILNSMELRMNFLMMIIKQKFTTTYQIIVIHQLNKLISDSPFRNLSSQTSYIIEKS